MFIHTNFAVSRSSTDSKHCSLHQDFSWSCTSLSSLLDLFVTGRRKKSVFHLKMPQSLTLDEALMPALDWWIAADQLSSERSQSQVSGLDLYWVALILPQGWAAQAESVSLQRASLVPTQVFAVLAAEGEATVLQELQREILRGLTIRAHQPGAVHVPEPTIHPCRI